MKVFVDEDGINVLKDEDGNVGMVLLDHNFYYSKPTTVFQKDSEIWVCNGCQSFKTDELEYVLKEFDIDSDERFFIDKAISYINRDATEEEYLYWLNTCDVIYIWSEHIIDTGIDLDIVVKSDKILEILHDGCNGVRYKLSNNHYRTLFKKYGKEVLNGDLSHTIYNTCLDDELRQFCREEYGYDGGRRYE